MEITINNISYDIDKPQEFVALCCAIESTWLKDDDEKLALLQKELEDKACPSTPKSDKLTDINERYEQVCALLEDKRASIKRAGRGLTRTTAAHVKRELFPPTFEQSYEGALQRIDTQDPTLTHIRLRKLSGAEVCKFSTSLPNNSHVQDLSIANGCYFGEYGARTLSHNIQKTNLAVLRLENCKISGTQWIHMLYRATHSLATLNEVHLTGWQINDTGMLNFSTIFQNTSVTVVTFNQTRIRSDEILASEAAVNQNRIRFDETMAIICSGENSASLNKALSIQAVSLLQIAGEWSRYVGYTPLMLATLSGNTETLQIIITGIPQVHLASQFNIRCTAIGPFFDKTILEIAQLISCPNQRIIFEFLSEVKVIVEKPTQVYFKKELSILYPNVSFEPEKLLFYKAMLDQTLKDRLSGRLGYSTNRSYALGMPVELIPREPVGFVDVFVENAKLYIIEHAQRRIELYFYLLVAYYKTGLYVELGKVRPGQDGTANPGLGKSDAGHSGLLNNVTDSVDSNGRKFNSLSHTHFFKNNLESTVEVPIGVNRSLDRHLEGDYTHPSELRANWLGELNKCTKKEINPTKCLSRALLFFKQELDKTENSGFMDHERVNSTPEARRRILDLVRIGTFKDKFDFAKMEVSPAYVDMLLRLKPAQLSQIQQHPEKADEIYEAQYDLIGNEIRTSPA